MGPGLRVVTAPPGDAVRVIADRLLARADTLARSMVERYREDIADYRLADEEFLFDDVQTVTVGNVRAAVASFLGDHAATPDALASTHDGAARRVRQGISLESFLHAARL